MEFRAKLIFVVIWLLYIVAEAFANVRGVAGIDYPNYSTIPKTSFKCSEQKKIPGFYADLETDCQVFHHCYKHRQESYLCAPGTIFNQALQTCDYWYSTTCKSDTSSIEGEKQEYKDEPLIPVAKKSSPFTVYEKMAALYEPHDELNSNFKQELQFDEDFQDFPKLPPQNKISESEAYSFTGMNTNKGSFKEYSERRMLNSLNPVEYQHESDISSDQEEDKLKENLYSITIKQNQSSGKFQNHMFGNSRNSINDDTSKEHDSFEVLDKQSLSPNAKDLSGQQNSGVETTVKKRKLRRKPTYVIFQTETDERSLNENLNSTDENKENSQILYDPKYKHDKIQLDTDSSKIATDMPITNTRKRNRKPINTLSTETMQKPSVSDVKNSVILDNIMTASLDEAPSVTETVNYKRRRPIFVSDVSDKPQDLAVENSGDNITTEESMHNELNSKNFSDELKLLFELLENFDGNQKVEPNEIEDLTQIKITETNENNVTTQSQMNFEFENKNKTVTELLSFDSDLNTNVELNKNIDSVSNKNLGSSFVNSEEAEISSVDNFTSDEFENSSLKHDIYLKKANGLRNLQTDLDNPDADNNDVNVTSSDINGVTSHALEETGVIYENRAENFNDGHWISNSGNEHSDYENTEVNIINNDSPNFSFVDSEEPHSSNEPSPNSYDINTDRPDQVTYKTTEYINDELVASDEGNKEFTTKTDEPDTTEEISDELSDVDDFDEENQEYTTIIYEYELGEEVSDEVRHMTEFEEENQVFTTIYERDLANAISDEHDFSTAISDEHDFSTAISDEHDLATAISDEHDLATAISDELDFATSDESITMANDNGFKPDTLEISGLNDIQSSSHKDEMLRIAGYNSENSENLDAQETKVEDDQKPNYRNLNPDFSFMNEEEANNENLENLNRNFDSDLSHLDAVRLKEKFAEIERETLIPVSPISTVVESQMGPALIQPVLRTLNKLEDGVFKENSISSGDAGKNSNSLDIGKSSDFTNLPKDHQNSFVVSEKNQHIKNDKISDLNELFIEESGGITEVVKAPGMTDASIEIDSVKEQKPKFDAETNDVSSLQTNINNPHTIQLNSVDDNPIFFKESDIPQNSVFPPNSMALPTNAYERNLYLQNLNQVQNKPNVLLKNSHVFPTTFYRELSPGVKAENTRGDIQKITPKPNLASLKAGFLKLKKNYIQANMFSPKSSEDSGFMASLKPYHTAATAWFKNLPSIFPSFNDDNAFQARSGKIKIAKKPKKFKVPKIIKLINFGRRLLRMKKAKINMLKKFIGI